MKDAIDTSAAADLVRATIIASAVAAVGTAESSKLAAIIGLAFVRSKEAFIAVHVEGAKTRKAKDIRSDVLCALVRDGRSIRKGEEIPPTLIGSNDATALGDYVKQTQARDLRTEIRGMFSLSDKVAGEVNKNHKQAMVTVLQAGTEDLGLARYRDHVAAHIADTLSALERRYAGDKAEGEEADNTWAGRVEKMTSETSVKRRLKDAAGDMAVVSKDAMLAARAFAPLLADPDLKALTDQLTSILRDRKSERDKAKAERLAAEARLRETVSKLADGAGAGASLKVAVNA